MLFQIVHQVVQLGQWAVLVVLLACCASCARQTVQTPTAPLSPPATSTGDWKLVWADEFDGPDGSPVDVAR